MTAAVASALTVLLVVILTNGMGRFLETRRQDRARKAIYPDTAATLRPNSAGRDRATRNHTIGMTGRRKAEFHRLFTLNNREHFGVLRHAAA